MKLADIGEGGDGIETLVDFFTAQPEHGAVHIDVLTPAELRIEARAQFQQRGDAPMGLDTAARRIQRAADHLQQRGFTATIATDDADRLAPLYFERNLLERPEFPEVLP